MDLEVKMKWAQTASPEELQAELEKITKFKDESWVNLNSLSAQKVYVDDKIKGLTKILPTLRMINDEADNLVGTIKNISASSDKISAEIKTLDTARSRIEECQKRVSDLIDLELCAQGVQKAINDEDYETGAGHIHRFLSIDQNLLTKTAADVEKASGIQKAVLTLKDAASQLQAIVQHRFDEAIRNVDLGTIERFFKIFPLLGMHDEGIRCFCQYLSTKIEEAAVKNMSIALNTSISDKRQPVVFADTLTLLFEGLARMIDTHQPLIETYYGPGRLLSAVSILQNECDKQCNRIMLEFNKNRQLNRKISLINEVNTGGSFSKLDRLDPKDLDILIGEMTVMHMRAELYIRYIRRKVTADLEISTNDDDEKRIKLEELEKVIKNSHLTQSKHELLGNYLRLEQYFMEESIGKAVNMDTFDTSSDQQTSSLVDDTFFIIRKCIRRAISTGSLDGCCAIINTGCRVLESDYCAVLKNKLKQGYPSGYLDLTQAYNVLQTSLQQGRLQPSDAEQARTTFLVALNNGDVSTEYVEALCDSVIQEIDQVMPNMKTNDRGKLESCLSGLSSVTTNLKDVIDYGMQQLRSSAVKPRVNPWVDAFLNVNHQFTEDELSAYEAGVPFVQTLMFNLDSLLSTLKAYLTPTNYDTLVGLVTSEITSRLEKVILKTTYNRLGGLILDKEVRMLAGYLTTSTSWSMRDKFARLTQIATILNLEKVSEIADYWGSHEGALTWRLTPSELRTIMGLRMDFKVEDIRRLKL
ncbi:PREDICTED: conserved oligomeric Golgi complex subunit 4 [Nicrophorus vespilloides]|uniref:Conserved oligomeric Golgi complex subunit 4 n=1 Tax=Nicrophorus vespilloides TaxID=110193 RepID=A0ABM1MH06_NICVS|nr:PREDICTED: conserved oligomeric Golgi complex subunit 4 [Nicrophorus vespilloides]